jgi:hypothetical protein
MFDTDTCFNIRNGSEPQTVSHDFLLQFAKKKNKFSRRFASFRIAGIFGIILCFRLLFTCNGAEFSHRVLKIRFLLIWVDIFLFLLYCISIKYTVKIYIYLL